MLQHIRRVCLAALALASTVATAAAQTLPPDFSVEDATPASSFVAPTAIAFLPDGRMLVTEKGGRVHWVDGGVKSELVDLRSQVLDRNDKGLLGVAVDPSYYLNHYIYLLYTVDPDSNGVETDPVAFGRLERHTVDFADSSVLVPDSRVVLMGTTWSDSPIIGSMSHTIGALRWGSDGTLLVSTGDGAIHTVVDSGNATPNLFLPGRADPAEDIGAFRSQMLGSLDGKILRIDPATGHGLPSNPFWDGNPASVRSRVWHYGLRNPFRFAMKPNTGSTNPAAGDPGTMYVPDVGWDTWEELNTASTGGRNFGWPCYEALVSNTPYQQADPAHHGCGTIGTPENPSLPSFPITAMHHDLPLQSTPPGFRAATHTGSVFYVGNTWPTTYWNRYFLCDYTQDWLNVIVTDSNDQLVNVLTFGTAMGGPVDLTEHPITHDLYYVAINVGEVRRIRYDGPPPENGAPTVVASASPIVGEAPLAVDFTSAGTVDPDNDPLAYLWNSGDGFSTHVPDTTYTYTTPGSYQVVVSVHDGNEHTVSDTLEILVTGTVPFPSTAVLDSFNRPDGPLGNGWVGDPGGLELEASVLKLAAVSASASYPTVFTGATQEAYLTFVEHDPDALEANLTMNLQGTAWWEGHIEVAYQPRNAWVVIHTYTPGPTWELRGGPFPVTFADGDQFGARLYPNGGIQVFKNGVLFGTASVAGWPWVALGGRIGVTLSEGGTMRWDNLGGGDAFPATASVRPRPSRLALSAPRPNPSRGMAQMELEMVRPGRVEFAIFDPMGRLVWSAPAGDRSAGRWTLAWPGTLANGVRAEAGVYLARVVVDGESLNRRFVLLH